MNPVAHIPARPTRTLASTPLVPLRQGRLHAAAAPLAIVATLVLAFALLAPASALAISLKWGWSRPDG